MVFSNSIFVDFFESIYPLDTKDTTDTVKYASHLNLYLKIDNVSQLKTKLYDKRDDFESKHTETGAYFN